MPVYRVSGSVTVSAETWVRAESTEEALRLARKHTPALAPYGPERSGLDPYESAIVESADGEFVAEAAVEDPNPPYSEEDEPEDEDDEP